MKRLALLFCMLAIALIGGGLLKAEEGSGEARAIPLPPGDGPKFIYFNPGGESHAWLGVELEDVDAQKAREVKLPGEYGAVVTDVRNESPAAKAGLANGDVILEFEGEKVRSVAHLRRLVEETPPGRVVSLLVSRSGQTRTTTATLAEPPERDFFLRAPRPALPRMEFPPMGVYQFAYGTRLGISADDLTPQLAEYFGVKQGEGVLVREVIAGSAAARAGLKAGDVIVAVDGKEVASVMKLRRALSSNQDEKRKVALTIVRDRRAQTLTVELEPPTPGVPRPFAEIEPPAL